MRRVGIDKPRPLASDRPAGTRGESIDSGLAVRIAFLTVGIWWIGFMIPMALNVPEPPAVPLARAHTRGSRGSPLRDAQRAPVRAS